MNKEKITHESFMLELKNIPDNVIIQEAEKNLSKLCSTGGRSFTMTVPPEINDTDMVLSELVVRLKSKIEMIEKLENHISEKIHKDRNTLGNITYLIDVLSDEKLFKFKYEAILKAKKAVNDLAEREVYEFERAI